MATAGLLTEGIFSGLHLIPTTRTLGVTQPHFEWNYTTFLNILFIGVAVAVWWLARNRTRLGAGRAYAVDPVCGMQVRRSDAPASAHVDGEWVYFCSDRCQGAFAAQGVAPNAAVPSGGADHSSGDPVPPVHGAPFSPP
jgi:YHS domain-containing protein